ncbi:beta-1,3-galactosyltransferase 1-like [Paramacrobiotus metropolitanus]|uniref:beta-1,3-galactosyltransferase 1-like n=1 Tax=Paramacrobiotus metropolitanus TaxID=2943436 RepID=UPI0024463A50|nr:beta-1,3-galactosyltransferase 1-like [Paramacrobiotus metropolitanus]
MGWTAPLRALLLTGCATLLLLHYAGPPTHTFRRTEGAHRTDRSGRRAPPPDAVPVGDRRLPTVADIFNPECGRFNGSVQAPYFLDYTASVRTFPTWTPRQPLPPGRYHFAIMTSPKHYFYRRAIRDTWMKTLQLEAEWHLNAGCADAHARTGSARFYVGQTAELRVAQRLAEEFRQFPDDMVFIQFCDVYESLPLKTYNVFHTLHATLPASVEWVVKIDDDVLPNLFLLMDCFPPLTQLVAAAPGGELVQILGSVGVNKSTEERYDPRYIIPRQRYNASLYPPFAHGPAYLVGRPAVGALLAAGRRTPLINLEDVWWTGLVASRAGLQLRNIHRFVLGGINVWKQLAGGHHRTDKAVWFYHDIGPKLLVKYWPNITQCCGCFSQHCWIYQAVRI